MSWATLPEVLLRCAASGSSGCNFDVITVCRMRLTCRAWRKALPLGEQHLKRMHEGHQLTRVPKQSVFLIVFAGVFDILHVWE